MAGGIRAIGTGWVVRDGVPGPSVDEFADPAEVIAARAGRDTLLAVQHPHRTPEAIARGLSLAEALPAARQALDRLKAIAYRRVHDVLALYRVSGPDGQAVGVLCLVDLDRVRHSEQVYPKVVAERAAVLTGLGCATSAAMLVPTESGDRLTETVLRAIDGAGPPSASTVDSGGRVHRLWLVGPGVVQDELLAVLGSGPLLLADGNHRVAAAAASGTDLLALITAGPGLRIGAIHRAVVGTGLTAADLATAWRLRGVPVRPATEPAPPAVPGTVVVRADHGLIVELPVREWPSIDHEVVERVLIAEALALDPEGPHVRPVPQGHPPGPGVDALLQLAPVPLADVLEMHRLGRRMPRKSTFFTPKPRSGLLLADVGGLG